jgi:hypothetical protein
VVNPAYRIGHNFSMQEGSFLIDKPDRVGRSALKQNGRAAASHPRQGARPVKNILDLN